MDTIYRNPLPQQFDHFALTVPAFAPANSRIQVSATAQSLEVEQYDAMIFSLPLEAAGPVYFGGPTITAGIGTNGLQIRPGIPINLSINNVRQLVELQAPLIDVLPALGGLVCPAPLAVPRIVWDVSNLWLTADVEVSIAVLLFRAML